MGKRGLSFILAVGRELSESKIVRVYLLVVLIELLITLFLAKNDFSHSYLTKIFVEKATQFFPVLANFPNAKSPQTLALILALGLLFIPLKAFLGFLLLRHMTVGDLRAQLSPLTDSSISIVRRILGFIFAIFLTFGLSFLLTHMGGVNPEDRLHAEYLIISKGGLACWFQWHVLYCGGLAFFWAMLVYMVVDVLFVKTISQES